MDSQVHIQSVTILINISEHYYSNRSLRCLDQLCQNNQEKGDEWRVVLYWHNGTVRMSINAHNHGYEVLSRGGVWAGVHSQQTRGLKEGH